MNFGDELSLDDIDAILAAPEPVSEPPRPYCRECGTKLDQGYCRNVECPVDRPIPTISCAFCGHCSTPGKCVASVECPRCHSGPSELCRDARGGITGYHEDRWLLTKEKYGVYYKA